MPLQIKELHIKVSVNGEEGGAENSSSETGSENSSAVAVMPQNQIDIISECVDQVLEILKEKLEP